MPRDDVRPVRMDDDLWTLAKGVGAAMGSSASALTREGLRRNLLDAFHGTDVLGKLGGDMRALADNLLREEAKAVRLREVEAQFEAETAP